MICNPFLNVIKGQRQIVLHWETARNSKTVLWLPWWQEVVCWGQGK